MTSTVLPPLGEDGLPEGWPHEHGIPSLAYPVDDDHIGVLAWAETELAQPDGDNAGSLWQWRTTQARMVAWWYALHPMHDILEGRFWFRRGQIVLPKGSGKSPIAAALSCCELAGPVVFAGFTETGHAIGRAAASPLVQLAAVSQDQTDNTMTLVLSMLRDGPASRHIPGLDTGITRVLTRAGKLQPVTASAASREGARLTAAILDETHLWTQSNGGHRLATTIRRNLGKMDGRSIETTNSWVAGELSVAENTSKYADLVAESAANDPTVDGAILRWHPHANVEDLTDEAALRAGLESLYGDYPWVNIDRVVAEIYDLGTPPSEARRFYLNQISADDDAWVAEYEWAARARPETAVADKDRIVLGFDGSRSRSRGVTDATALIGCRVTDGHLFPIRVWEQPENRRDWTVPTTEVEATIADTFTRFDVVGFYADPALWETFIAAWEAKYGPKLKVKASPGHPIQWRMNRPTVVVESTGKLYSAIVDGEMSHSGSSILTRHVLNARRRTGRSGVQIAKEHPDSVNKVDAAVASILAWQARLDAIAAGLGRQTSTAIRRVR